MVGSAVSGTGAVPLARRRPAHRKDQDHLFDEVKVQIGLGLSGQLTRNVSLFGRTDYNIALDQPGHSLGARAGLKVVW